MSADALDWAMEPDPTSDVEGDDAAYRWPFGFNRFADIDVTSVSWGSPDPPEFSVCEQLGFVVRCWLL